MSTKTTSGDATECSSADVVAPADDYMVDVEFLNTITLPNFPSLSLKLKKYMPLMLLRNLSPCFPRETPCPAHSLRLAEHSCLCLEQLQPSFGCVHTFPLSDKP